MMKLLTNDVVYGKREDCVYNHTVALWQNVPTGIPVSYTHLQSAFATGVPPNIYAFHRYTRNSDCPSDTQDLQFQMPVSYTHLLQEDRAVALLPL